jgi:hypothetical protein
MLSNNVIKITVLVMVLSLTGCVAPTTPQSTAVTASNEAVTVAAPEATLENDPIVTVNFLGGGGSWEGFGSVLFRYTAIARNNEVYICGAYTGRGSPNIRGLTREVMKQASVTAGGQTIMRNLRFFAEASNANFSSELVGVETNCRSTGQSLDAVPLSSVRVQTRDGRYRISG